jgi:hypothetical protein
LIIRGLIVARPSNFSKIILPFNPKYRHPAATLDRKLWVTQPAMFFPKLARYPRIADVVA